MPRLGVPESLVWLDEVTVQHFMAVCTEEPQRQQGRGKERMWSCTSALYLATHCVFHGLTWLAK